MATKIRLPNLLKDFMRTKKIVVTGSRGFVGTNLMRALPDAIGWDGRDGHDIFSPDFNTVTRDADLIIHLAAQVSVTKSIADPEATLRLNTKGTLRVLEAAEQNKAKVIFLSSASVYDTTGYTYLRETDPLNPNNPYAQSKIECEHLCAAFRERFPVIVLRPFNLYGFNPLPQDDSVINRFINGTKEGEIVINGDGTQIRDFVNVKDLVNVILEAVDKPFDWASKTINVGTGIGTNMIDLASYFVASTKKKVAVTYRDTNFGVKSAVADTYSLRQLYPYPFVTNLKKDIKEGL